MIFVDRWRLVYTVIFCVMVTGLTAITLAVPRTEEGIQWTQPMVAGGWMAWTFPVALFFYALGSVLVVFSVWAIRYPETPRRGMLGFYTTRGDRLFVTLLGSAFIHLGWLYFFGAPLTGALIICSIYAGAIFRWV